MTLIRECSERVRCWDGCLELVSLYMEQKKQENAAEAKVLEKYKGTHQQLW